MDFKKLITISLKDVRITFGDRNLLLIMILAPLALTFIIGAAFSKFVGGSSNDLPIEKPKIAVVNEDTGITFPGQPKLSFGDILTQSLTAQGVPLNAQTMSHDDAIAQVDKGNLDAAVIIPTNFTTALIPIAAQIGQTKLTYYRNAGSSIGADIGESIVHNIVNNILSGDIADFAVSHLVADNKADSNLSSPQSQQAIAQKVSRQLQNDPPIQINNVSIGGQAAAQTFDPLQYFAPSMAVFFLTFTMAGGVVGIIEERDRGTLQRLLSSPTSRLTILVGKFGGTYLNGTLQLGVLIIATSLIAPILGSKSTVWGSNIPGIILITLCAVAAAVGLGTLVTGFAKTAQQADTASNAILILSGILGGSFFNIGQFSPALQNASKITLNYWAINAYNTLAQGGSISAILPNIVALLLMFVVYFGIGVMLFNRRLDV